MKKNKGITLVALVITIIILIILAGVSINLVLGKYGIVNRASSGTETYSEKQAKEKLEIELANMYIEKTTNINYNDEYLTTKLSEKGFSVNGNIVIVDGYQFQIDRSVPQIMNSLGKGIENEEITLTAASNLKVDYTKSTIKIEITYAGTLKEVNLNGESLTIPEAQDGKYVIEKEIEKNGNYNVLIKDSSDGYKIANVEVKNISEDTNIGTVEQFIAFRDRVNAGATYAGRTVTLEKDLDLSKVCHYVDGTTAKDISWIPIGTDTKPFKGTFNGNDHTINNLYINTTNEKQGLFGVVESATISHVNIGKGSQVKGGNTTAGIVGIAGKTNIQYCINHANITGATYSGGISAILSNGSSISNCGNTGDVYSSGHSVGGVVGIFSPDQIVNISECYNTGNVTSTGKDPSNNSLAGGIIGFYYRSSGTIKNCYNTGTVNAKYPHIGGIIGNRDNGPLIANCYNVGNLTGSNTYRGSICGFGRATKFQNCYWTTSPAVAGGSDSGAKTNCSKKTEAELKGLASTLGDAFVADGKIKNEKGEWVDNKDEKGNIIYINNGFPVLKWQLEI